MHTVWLLQKCPIWMTVLCNSDEGILVAEIIRYVVKHVFHHFSSLMLIVGWVEWHQVYKTPAAEILNVGFLENLPKIGVTPKEWAS